MVIEHKNNSDDNVWAEIQLAEREGDHPTTTVSERIHDHYVKNGFFNKLMEDIKNGCCNLRSVPKVQQDDLLRSRSYIRLEDDPHPPSKECCLCKLM